MGNHLRTDSLSLSIERSLFRAYVLAIVVPISRLQQQCTHIIKIQLSALLQALSHNGNDVDLQYNIVFYIEFQNKFTLVSFFLNFPYLFWTISSTWRNPFTSYVFNRFFFEVYNSMQGWMIFILLVFLRKRVKKLLAERKPYVINFPKYWSAYNVEEVASPSAFDIELSNAPWVCVSW